MKLKDIPRQVTQQLTAERRTVLIAASIIRGRDTSVIMEITTLIHVSTSTTMLKNTL